MPPNKDSDIGVEICMMRLRGRRRRGKRLVKKWIDVFLKTPSLRLFQLTDFVRCMRTLLNWVPKSLIQVQKSVMQVQSCSFALNLNLLLFWRARWRITVLPIVHPSKEPTCMASSSFHCVCSLNEYRKRLWNQNFQAQKNRRISDRITFSENCQP